MPRAGCLLYYKVVLEPSYDAVPNSAFVVHAASVRFGPSTLSPAICAEYATAGLKCPHPTVATLA